MPLWAWLMTEREGLHAVMCAVMAVVLCFMDSARLQESGGACSVSCTMVAAVLLESLVTSKGYHIHPTSTTATRGADAPACSTSAYTLQGCAKCTTSVP